MAEKLQLPDAFLDAVSGGTVTYDGKPVTGYDFNTDGWSVTTAAGTFTGKWSIQDKLDAQKSGGIESLNKAMDTLMAPDAGTYALESFGLPGPGQNRA